MLQGGVDGKIIYIWKKLTKTRMSVFMVLMYMS